MKKRIFSLIFILVLAFVLIGCEKEHSAVEAWSSDNEYHWHACNQDGCDEVFEKAAHTFDEGVQIKAPTLDSEGEMKYTCTVCGKEKVEAIAKLKNIAGILEGKNNDDAFFTATVFALTNDGVYVSDGSAGIYVKPSSSAALNGINAGTVLEIEGKFAISNGQPFVKNAKLTSKGSGATSVSPATLKLSEVNALSGDDRANYGKLYSIVAAVSKDEANRIVLTDDSGSIVLADACYSSYEAYIDKKVDTKYALVSKSGSTWTAYAFSDSAKEYFVNVDEVKDAIFATISLPEAIYGALDLVTSYESEPGVLFTWSVKEGTALSITDNKVSVDLGITEDASVTLLLTLTSGATKATKEFTLTVKAMKNVSLGQGVNEEGYVVIKDAVVVGAGVADEKSVYHYIIALEKNTGGFYLLDVSSDVRKTVKAGDVIDFVAKWRSDETIEEGKVARPAYEDIQVIVKKEETYNVDYATLGAIDLENLEDYQYAIDNLHDSVRLYRIVSPFLVGSGSSNYNWYQFGPTLAAAANGVTNSRQFSLLIKNFAENGLSSWESTYNVPTKTQGAKQYPGLVLYAFSVYQTGDTKWSFIVPCEAASFESIEEKVNVAIKEVMFDEITASSAGTATLPASVVVDEVTYALTWTSSDDSLLNGSTGAYPVLYDEASVVLTASFKVGEENKQFSYTVKLLASEVEAISVSEAIAQAKLVEGGEIIVPKLEAYIAAIGASSENNSEFRYGIMLTDGKKVVYFKTTDYTIGEHDLAAYDKIVLRGAKLAVDKDGHVISDFAKAEFVSSNNTIDYSQLEIDAVVTNDEELAAFIGSHGVTHGLVVKFAGDSIYFVGTGSTSINGRYQVNYKKAANSSSARYTYDLETNNSKSLAFSMQCSKLLLGRNWWEDCGMPEKSGSTAYEVEGSFIAVGGYNGNTLHAWTIINADEFKLTKVSDATLAKRAIISNTTKEYNAYAAGVATLPTSVKVGEVDIQLTWTSSDDAVLNASTGAYAAVTSEKTVVLTAKFTIAATEYSQAVEIKLLATEPEPLTVTEALASQNGDSVTVKGAIIAFISDGNSGEAIKGFMLMDNATGKILAVHNVSSAATYPNYVYLDSSTPLAIGDSVKVRGTYSKNAGEAEYIDMNAEGKVEFVEKVTLNFHEGEEGSAVVVINNDAELAALIASGDYYGKILKLVATNDNPLHISGSGTNASTVCNFKIGYHYGDGSNNNQIYYDNLTISTKSDVNAPNTDGTTTFSKDLYGATREDGKMGASTNNERVGVLYITICYKTSTYYQSSIVNFVNCGLTAKPTE